MAPRRRDAPRSVIVVGAGLAGSQTVAALRAQGFDGHVAVLGAEGLAPYDRPPLSKHLMDRAEPAWLADELGDDLQVLADAVHLDRPARALTFEGGGVAVQTDDGPLAADAVVIATGAHAVRPAVGRALTLHTADDARRLRALVRPDARLVIIGAGWIGAEVAGVASAAGAHVSVVEALPAPLAGALGVDVGARTVPWYAAAGVELITQARVADVQSGSVRLADGRVLDADVVLAAVGARASTAWLAGTLALAADGSVLVDESYVPVGGPRTVRAVGDVASRVSPRHGRVPGGHWDGALRGPAVAVRSLLDPGAGVTSADDLAPYVFSTQLGHDLTVHGHAGPGDDVVRRDPVDPARGWSVLWFARSTDTLTALLTVDGPRDVAAARHLFTGRTLPRLDRARAADATIPLRSTQIA